MCRQYKKHGQSYSDTDVPDNEQPNKYMYLGYIPELYFQAEFYPA